MRGENIILKRNENGICEGARGQRTEINKENKKYN